MQQKQTCNHHRSLRYMLRGGRWTAGGGLYGINLATKSASLVAGSETVDGRIDGMWIGGYGKSAFRSLIVVSCQRSIEKYTILGRGSSYGTFQSALGHAFVVRVIGTYDSNC